MNRSLKSMFLFAMLACLPFAGFSQENEIKITLSPDSVFVTNYLELIDDKDFQAPFIRVDRYDGPKIHLKDISGYEGVDQHGIHRRLTTYWIEEGKEFRYTESMFEDRSTESARILHHDQYFVDAKHRKSSSVVKYSLDDEKNLKELSYKNLLEDFKKRDYMNADMKKARQIKTLQYITSGLGACLFGAAIYENRRPGQQKFLNQSNMILLSASGLMISVPIVLNKPRKDFVMKALRNY